WHHDPREQREVEVQAHPRERRHHKVGDRRIAQQREPLLARKGDEAVLAVDLRSFEPLAMRGRLPGMHRHSMTWRLGGVELLGYRRRWQEAPRSREGPSGAMGCPARAVSARLPSPRARWHEVARVARPRELGG